MEVLLDPNMVTYRPVEQSFVHVRDLEHHHHGNRVVAIENKE